MTTPEKQEEKDLPDTSDPLWQFKLPLTVANPPSEKGKYIFLGSCALLFIILMILNNYGIIGR